MWGWGYVTKLKFLHLQWTFFWELFFMFSNKLIISMKTATLCTYFVTFLTLEVALILLEVPLVHAKSPWTRHNFEMQIAPSSLGNRSILLVTHAGMNYLTIGLAWKQHSHSLDFGVYHTIVPCSTLSKYKYMGQVVSNAWMNECSSSNWNPYIWLWPHYGNTHTYHNTNEEVVKS